MACHQICCALACAERHTGPSTTIISVSTEAVRHSLLNALGQPRFLTSPSTLPNVTCLWLLLEGGSSDDDNDIGQFARKLLDRLPNLVYATLLYSGSSKLMSFAPLPYLKHLDLRMQSVDALNGMPVAALFPVLVTAGFSVSRSGSLMYFDVMGCRQLRRLVLKDILVCHLLKLPQCKVRVNFVRLRPADLETKQLQAGLSEVHQVFLHSRELYSHQGLVARVCLAKVEVISCDWSIMMAMTMKMIVVLQMRLCTA